MELDLGARVIFAMGQNGEDCNELRAQCPPWNSTSHKAGCLESFGDYCMAVRLAPGHLPLAVLDLYEV